MIEKTTHKKRRLILILILLLVLFPTAFFLSRSVWSNGSISTVNSQIITNDYSNATSHSINITSTPNKTSTGNPSSTPEPESYDDQDGQCFFIE